MKKSRISAIVSICVVAVLSVMLWSCAEMSHSPDEARPPAPRKATRTDRLIMGMPKTLVDAPVNKEKKADTKEEPPAPVETWRRSQIRANTARLMIGDKEELDLKGTQINVWVDGFRARVLMDMYFYNNRDRTFEGTFKLRLPNGASPYFLAFGEMAMKAKYGPADIVFDSAEDARNRGWTPEKIMDQRARQWKAPKEARVVPKERAVIAYRETVRKSVDPALMEWAGAGIFNARVFPLTPRKTHRIVVGYDVDLVRAGDDLEYRLDLPENTSKIQVDIQVKRLPGVAMVMSPMDGGKRYNDRMHFRYEIPLERSLKLTLKGAGAILMTGNDEATGRYFAARFRPDLPESPVAGGRQGIFLVDISASSNPDRFNVWLGLLEAILNNNRESMKQFAVMFFNIETFWWKEAFSANTPENVAELISFCKTLALEGATDIRTALEKGSVPVWLGKDAQPLGWDMFLLSDGSPTWGESDNHALSSIVSGKAGSLFAYQTGMSGTDTALLSHLARETGGAVFSVVGEVEVEKASRAHLARPWRLAGIEIQGGRDVLLAGRPSSIFPGQALYVVGRGNPYKDGEVVLELKQGTEIKTVRTRFATAIESDLTKRAYGQVAVGQLEEFKDATRSESESYARYFRVAGKTCSLLMLESERDYLRFNIKPQQDAFVVKSTKPSEIIGKALKQGGALSSAKKAFTGRLEKLKSLPGMDVELSPAFRIVLDQLGDEFFEVGTPHMACILREAGELPGLVRDQLKKGKLDYDVFMLEADRRYKKFGKKDALKALSSLIETNPGNIVMERDVGFSAMELGLGGNAYHLFRSVADSRPHEPETYRIMARCLEDLGQSELAMAYYELGMSAKWDDRFGAFRQILAMDYMRFLKRIKEGIVKTSVGDYAESRLESLEKEFKIERADLVATISWNTDGTDVDLHVVEPGGEECFFRHPKTKQGGQITPDVTQGYGPEMYMIKKAAPGKYNIRVKYYAEDQNRASTRTRVFVTIYLNWGTKKEEVIEKVVTLEYGEEMHDLETVRVRGLW